MKLIVSAHLLERISQVASTRELAVYLGHITKRGTPAIQTTARYTQSSMDQIREKLKGMKGR